MKKLYLLQINHFLYLSIHIILRKAYSISDEGEHIRFMAHHVLPLSNAYELVNSFLEEYDGVFDFIDVDYSQPINTFLSKMIFEHFPSYRRHIDEGIEKEQIQFCQNFQPISELHSTLRHKRYSEKLEDFCSRKMDF